MSDEPCPFCRSRFAGLCRALDDARTEAAELRAERYRHIDGLPIAERAPSPTSATVCELRLELADAQHHIGELEKANRHWRDVAAAERRRAEHAEDAQRRSLRVALGIPVARHA
jgi:DNA-binding ferritin-like protein